MNYRPLRRLFRPAIAKIMTIIVPPAMTTTTTVVALNAQGPLPPSRRYGTPQQPRGPREYDDGGDGRRLPARPRSPYSDVGEREYGKVEVRSTMSSRGGSLLDRLSTGNRTGEREVMEDRFDDRGAITDTNPASNGRDPTGERKDNGRRRRRIKGSRR